MNKAAMAGKKEGLGPEESGGVGLPRIKNQDRPAQDEHEQGRCTFPFFFISMDAEGAKPRIRGSRIKGQGPRQKMEARGRQPVTRNSETRNLFFRKSNSSMMGFTML